jgi:AraC-like DNA-binding protein
MKETASESAPAAERSVSSAEDVVPARRVRVRELFLAGKTIDETAAALGVHRSTVQKDRVAIGLRSPRGPRPKRSNESRACGWCGELFLATGSELARGGGRYCSPGCFVEASNPCREILTVAERHDTVARLYVLHRLTMGEIAAELGMNKPQVHKDLKRLGLTGRRNGVSFAELGGENLARIRTLALADLVAYCEKHKLWTARQVIEYVWTPDTSNTNLTRRAPGLEPAEVRRFGLWQWTLYRPSDVKRWVQDRRATASPQLERHYDPGYGKRWRRATGAKDAAVKKYGAAVVERAVRHGRIRVGTGRKSSTAERDAEWLADFDGYYCDLVERHPYSPVDGEESPTRWSAAVFVAYARAAELGPPYCDSSGELVPSLEQQATRLVWNAAERARKRAANHG